jgi:HK97 family phage major capsid protein
MKSYQDQVKDLEATLLAKKEQMSAIIQKAAEEGRSTDAEETERFDALDAEAAQIVKNLDQISRLESMNVTKATRIVADKADKAGDLRGAPSIHVKRVSDVEDKFPGQSFVRRVIAQAVAREHNITAGQVAEHRWGKTNPQLVQVIKTGVAGAGSDSGEWGAELVTADSRYTGDFIEYLYGKTLFDQLGLREVPANVTIKGQDGAATAAWVGQSKGIPVTSADFSTVNLTPLKVAAIAVGSKEWLADSSPSAEMLIRDALVQASSQKVDGTFFSTTAVSSGVSPAGILNGVAGFNSYGPTQEGVIGDIKRLVGVFQTAKNSSGLIIVTTPALATGLGLMLTSLGQAAFPGLTQEGGNLRGFRVLTGDNVPSGAVIMMKPSDIYRIGDMGITVSVSDVATIEQDTSPTGVSDTPVAASATIMSMFGTESVAFKVVRRCNFAKRRTSAVAYVDNADYGATDTSS